MKKILKISYLCLALLLWGCTNDATKENNVAAKTDDDAMVSYLDGEMFTDRDIDASYDETASVKIYLEDGNSRADNDAVAIEDDQIMISEEGTYILSGSLSNGRIIVDAADTAKIQLVLAGVDIHADGFAAIYIKEADKVFITLADDSENTLSSAQEFVSIDNNNVDATVFSKADLTFNGSGSLTVNSENGHGIVSKDDLVFAQGSYDITALDHAISGKDSIRIADGEYSVVAGKDALHSENNDDDSKGFVYIAAGSFDLTSDGDGISASSLLQIDDGDFKIVAGGSHTNGEQHNSDDLGMIRPMERPMDSDMASQATETASSSTATTDEDVSCKGIKAGAQLVINGGTFELDTADDAIHSNQTVEITGGEFTIATGDDGMHADDALIIMQGTIDITTSYEGIEGFTIDIMGGDITIVSSDDGLNAAGGNDQSGFGGRGNDMFAAQEGADITISGGAIKINAQGDGIDSNGNLTIEGGTIIVEGPENGGNSALDYNGVATISNGTFIATDYINMAQNFSSAEQGTMLISVDTQQAGTQIVLHDSDGNEIVDFTASKGYNCVIISAPQIVQGETYELSAGTYSAQITMDELIYGSGNQMMGPGNRSMNENGQPNFEENAIDGSDQERPTGKGGMNFNERKENGDMAPPSGGDEMSEQPTI